jgi:hypothetical protein
MAIRILLLRPRTALACDSLSGTPLLPGVGPGTLSVHWQVFPVADASIATNLLQSLDIHGNLASQVALNPVIPINHFAESRHLGLGQIPDSGVAIHISHRQDLLARRPANAQLVCLWAGLRPQYVPSFPSQLVLKNPSPTSPSRGVGQSPSLAVAYVSDSRRSLAPRRAV